MTTIFDEYLDKATEHKQQPKSDGARLDVERYLTDHGHKVVKIKPHMDGSLYCLEVCLFDQNHAPNEAGIYQAGGGMLSYQCFHEGCKGRTWKEARQDISGNVSLAPWMVGGNGQRARPASATAEQEVMPEDFELDRFVMNGLAEEMEAQMLDDKYVLGRLAILGQSTAFYAKPNYGKTLLTIYELISGIKSGDLNPSDIFYINADDNHKGLVYKLKLAERYGFKMLAPGYRDFQPDMLHPCLDTKNARGKIVILDTVKKFADLMRKDKVSEFCSKVRQFVSRGGTAIMMAHTNKHRGEDGKLVFGGVSDLVDDSDCAYMLDLIHDDPATGMRTVKFENIKNRGDVVLEAFYKYNFLPGTPYHDRLESVSEVLEDERKEAEKQARLDALLAKNQRAVDAIKSCIRDGVTKKTELINTAAERSGLTKPAITKALTDHQGTKVSEHQFWYVAVFAKNANVYALNYGVEG